MPRERWLEKRRSEILPAKYFHVVFMGTARQDGDIKLSGDGYNRLKTDLYEKNWIIDVRDPVNNPEHVLEYLARYTHRVAIAKGQRV